MDPRRRMSELELTISDYPRQVAQARRRLADIAAQTVLGQDAGGLVTVTVTALGVVTSVHLSPRALRDLDDRRLADCVRDAANQALIRAEETVNAVAEEPRVDDVDSRLAAFEGRVDDILCELDRVSSGLDDLVD